MTNVKVKTVGAIFNGQPIGSTVELSKAEAEHYAKLGYVEVLPEEKAAKKSESAPKPAKSNDKKSAPKTKDK
jgi:hypothetical protein